MTIRKKVALSVGLLVAVLLIVEVLLRATLGLGSPPLLQADDEIGYLFKAEQDVHRFGNRVSINSFHQRSGALSGDERILRVLFVGDSVTWGGVLVDQQETYPEFFEMAISETCHRPVETLNASAGSWGIGNQLAYLERFGTFDSEMVIMQIGSHDLLQSTSTAEVVGRHRAFPDESPALAIEELFTRYMWPRLQTVLGTFTLSVHAHAWSQATTPPHAGFERNMQKLASMIKLIRAAGGKPLVLYAPDRNEVVRENGTFSNTYEPYRPAFYALADSLNVPVIDIFAKWQGSPDAPAYFRDGVHFSEEGNEAVGAVLHAKLSELSLAAACQK